MTEDWKAMKLRLVQETTVSDFGNIHRTVDSQVFSVNKLRRGDLLLSRYLHWKQGNLTARLQPDERSVMIFGTVVPPTVLDADNPVYCTGILPLDYATCEVTVEIIA